MKGREGGRRRETSMYGYLSCPLLGMWPATQPCALTGNQTHYPLVCRLALNPLSHTSQGAKFFLKKEVAPVQCGSVGWCSSWEVKGLLPTQGWFQLPNTALEHVGEATHSRFSLTLVCSSLAFPLPSRSLKMNKISFKKRTRGIYIYKEVV